MCRSQIECRQYQRCLSLVRNKNVKMIGLSRFTTVIVFNNLTGKCLVIMLNLLKVSLSDSLKLPLSAISRVQRELYIVSICERQAKRRNSLSRFRLSEFWR